MEIKESKSLNQEANFEEFYKRCSATIPSLKKFAASKLNLAEKEGLIDKGFYDANEILDEVFMEVFKFFSNDLVEKKLRQILFLRTIQKINHKIERENQFAEDFNIELILKDELNLLKEDYSIEAAGDYIFDEDLDDIPYKQNSFNPAHFILDQSMELEITGKLDLSDNQLFSDRNRALFGASFYTLPPISKNIIELYIFANQTVTEISEILNVNENTVSKVINRIKERLEIL